MASAWDEIRKKAKEQTDNKFASKVSSLTKLTDVQVRELAPSPIEKERLADLLSVVYDATKTNNEKAQAIRSIEGFAEVIIPLLLKLA